MGAVGFSALQGSQVGRLVIRLAGTLFLSLAPGFGIGEVLVADALVEGPAIDTCVSCGSTVRSLDPGRF